METADGRYQMPSRKYLSQVLMPQKFGKLCEAVIAALKRPDYVCTTVDLWTNRQMRSCFGMTAHYIADGTQHSAMLACSRFRGSHTGFAIAKEFEKVLSSFQVAKKEIVTVTDSAANMMKAFSLYRLPSDEFEDCDSNEEEVDVNVDNDAAYYSDFHEHIPCFAHTLQLAIKDGLQQAPNVKRVLGKVSAIVAHVKKSVHSSEVLETEKCLQTATVTRWNSQQSMIKPILKIPADKLNSINAHRTLSPYKKKL